MEGTYQIAVFVFDDQNELIGFGCDANALTIENGKHAQRGPIVVQEVP